MTNRSSKIFVIVAAILVIAGYFYTMDKDTIFSVVTEPLEPVDWNEVEPRFIIEFSVPITIVEKIGNDCTVFSGDFDPKNLVEFMHATDLENKLKYNAEEETIVIPCDKMHGDPSEFTIWWVTSNANAHQSKYEYYIDPYDGTLGRGVDYWDQAEGIIAP